MFNIIKSQLKSYVDLNQFKSLSIYVLTNFISKGISFFFFPFFTYLLSPKDIGLINNFSAFVVFLSPFVYLGVVNILTVNYYKVERQELKKMLKSGLILPPFICILFLFIFYISFKFLAQKIEFQISFVSLVPLTVFFNLLSDLLLQILRFEDKPVTFLILNTTKILVELITAFILIFYLKFGWEGRIVGIVLSASVAFLVFIHWFVKERIYSAEITLPHVRNSIKTGFVSIISFLSVFMLTSADKFFITSLLDASQTGYYSIASTLAGLMLALTAALLNFFTPKLYALFQDSTSKRAIFDLYKKYCLLSLYGCISILILGLILYYKVINPIYIKTIPIFFILLLANLVWAITNMFYAILWYYEQITPLIFISLLSILLTAIANFWGTKYYGITGTALMVLLSITIHCIMNYIYSKRVLNTFYTNP